MTLQTSKNIYTVPTAFSTLTRLQPIAPCLQMSRPGILNVGVRAYLRGISQDVGWWVTLLPNALPESSTRATRQPTATLASPRSTLIGLSSSWKHPA